eukprot:746338-Hanusia_phi.AAC.4
MRSGALAWLRPGGDQAVGRTSKKYPRSMQRAVGYVPRSDLSQYAQPVVQRIRRLLRMPDEHDLSLARRRAARGNVSCQQDTHDEDEGYSSCERHHAETGQAASAAADSLLCFVRGRKELSLIVLGELMDRCEHGESGKEADQQHCRSYMID